MVYDIIVGRDKAEKERFGKKGTIFLGKSYVKMNQTSSLANNILLDVARSHVILVAGKRGSGKSTSLGVIAEEMVSLPEEISKNLSVILLDTMGIFWTMKYPNLRDEKLLQEWNLKPKAFDVNIFVPEGYFRDYKNKGLPVDYPFTIKTSEIGGDDWCNVFNVKITDPIGVLIEGALKKLKDKEYGISDIIDIIKKENFESNIKNAAINRFLNAEEWGIFAHDGTPINDLIIRGKVTILDISAYTQTSGSWDIKNLVVGIIAKKFLKERILSRKYEELENIESSNSLFLDTEKELEKPLVWIFLDEGHEFLPRKGKTAATDALVQLLREGRQPGVSLVVATQQPGEIHNDVLTQSDIVISHRLTAKVDIDALNTMMQSYLLENIQTFMNQLPNLKGSAIILDDNSERIYPMRVRPKLSWHGGEAPSAIKYNKREEMEKELNIISSRLIEKKNL